LTGGVSISRRDSNDCDGSTRDLEGWLVTCEHGARRIIRIEKDGSITVIADSDKGKRVNAPNDVVVTSGGAVPNPG
jgi:gluconolactonase